MAGAKIVTESTLANRAKRVVLNRAAFDAITIAIADGAFELAKSIIGSVHVPDAPPIGKGLVQHGGVLAFVGKKRVGAWSTGPELPFTRPKASKLTAVGVTVIGGFGKPMKLYETGSIHQPARPVVTPALMSGLPGAEPFIKAACRKHKIIGAARKAAAG
jgi:hypothetical protein